jgi:hypothetical protein
MGSTFKKIIVAFVLFTVATLSTAVASPEFDRVYQLETVGWLKSSDNVDDIFADFLDQQYSKFFEKQSRFLVKKISSIQDVLAKSDAPYATLIENADVLKKISQKFMVEGLIRTKVYKESATYRFVMEWIYAPKGTVLAQHEFRFVDPGKAEGLMQSELPVAIQNALEQLVDKLPFKGQVTGVEGEIITVNIGRHQNVKPREILVIYTLQGVKVHPKLNTIEEWKWQPIGRAKVEQVEDSLAFAKITELEEGKNLIRFQKVKEILPAPPEPVKLVENALNESPRIGWISGAIGLASYIRESGSTSNRFGGNGLSESVDLDGLFWMNSRFLAQASLSGALIGYSPENLVTNANTNKSYSGTFSQLRLSMGYSLFPAKTIFDTIGWVHFGYRSTNYSLAPDDTTLTGGSSFDSLFIGLGGELPIRNITTLQMNIDVGLINSASCRAPAFGDPSTVTDLQFQLGAVFHQSDKWNLRMLLKLNSQSMDFTSGESVSQKLLSVGPSLLYYF